MAGEAEVVGAVRQYITKDLLGSDVKLEEDTPLLEGGHLTSLQTVELVGFLSDHFGVEIEPEEVNEEEFRSLRTIAALVLRKRA
jgi:methoxymalonate biosynthesis acyl carrier protein